jgi:hypothetical protein
MQQATRSLQPAPRAERLSWNQICKRYPDQWVAIVDIEDVEGAVDITSAVVFAHCDKRDQLSPHVRAAHQQFISIGTFWTGTIRGPSLIWRFGQ